MSALRPGRVLRGRSGRVAETDQPISAPKRRRRRRRGVRVRLSSSITIGDLIVAIAATALTFRLDREVKSSARVTQEQMSVMRAAAEAETAVIREQIKASYAQGEAIREAARAQLQPLVFAEAISTPVRGRNDPLRLGLADAEVGFPYYLSNEGTGIALNIRHGLEVAGREYEFGGGMETRVLRAGESFPPRDPLTGRLGKVRPLLIVRDESDLPPQWQTMSPTLWARFENVFGDQFETRSPFDPQSSAAFARIDPDA
jgi:type II secretory pathway pseudopilin PulG